MIRTKKGTTIVKGSISEILADLTVITASLHESLSEDFGAEKAKEEIMRAVQYGLASDEEREAIIKETMDRAFALPKEAVERMGEE